MIRWVLSCATQFNARRESAGITGYFKDSQRRSVLWGPLPKGLT